MDQANVALKQAVYPGLRYVDARAALTWLQRAFGFEPQVVYDGPDGTVAHAQILVAGNVVMLGTSRDGTYPVRSPREVGGVTGGIYVALLDAAAVDALHVRAEAAGADILEAPHDTDYGSHDFSALDLEGHPWNFGTYQPQAGAPGD
jgi:uncharacterized glyoxalase superfamily protein PhnB